MPGLVPGIHGLLSRGMKDVDGRDKPGHDGETEKLQRQCSNRASAKLISFPTASPNSDNITTPASS